MLVDFSKEAEEEFRKLYLAYPDLSSYQQDLLDNLLYHLSSNTSLCLTVQEGSLVIRSVNRKPWQK